MKSEVADWLLALMVAFAPPERAARHDQFPGWEETPDQRRERYAMIGRDLYEFVYDPETKPIFGGKKGRARTAALLLAISYHESGFAKDVDIGPCYRGKNGQSARCDSGISACMMQIHIGNGQTVEGWTKKDLFADRKKCFAAGLRLIRKSFSACRKLPMKHRLNAYASGSCSKGQAGSERLMALADKFTTRLPLPGPDEGFIRKKKDSEPAKKKEARRSPWLFGHVDELFDQRAAASVVADDGPYRIGPWRLGWDPYGTVISLNPFLRVADELGG